MTPHTPGGWTMVGTTFRHTEGASVEFTPGRHAEPGVKVTIVSYQGSEWTGVLRAQSRRRASGIEDLQRLQEAADLFRAVLRDRVNPFPDDN